jgi:hypothetical protein
LQKVTEFWLPTVLIQRAMGKPQKRSLLMDLKSGRPFWPIKNGPLGHYFPLDPDVDCEVAIVGAGITGALVAYYLIKEGVHTVIVDRREVGTGSTSATTGLLQYEVDTPLFELIGRVGEKKAVRSYHVQGKIHVLDIVPASDTFNQRHNLRNAAVQQAQIGWDELINPDYDLLR